MTSLVKQNTAIPAKESEIFFTYVEDWFMYLL